MQRISKLSAQSRFLVVGVHKDIMQGSETPGDSPHVTQCPAAGSARDQR